MGRWRLMGAVAVAIVSGCGLRMVGQGAPPGDAPNGSNTPPKAEAGGGGGDDASGNPGDDAGVDASPAPDAAMDAEVDAGPCAACGPAAPQTLCVANACVPTRRVFVSSSASTGNLGGISGADTQCQSLATAAKLGGSWRAWVSSNASSPSTRFAKASVPYRLLDGTTIAASWNDLTSGTLLHGIDRDEKGVVTAGTEVWTATTTSGDFDTGGCNGFTSGSSSSPTAAQGITGQTSSQWTNVYVQFCDRTNPRIYCFEQ